MGYQSAVLVVAGGLVIAAFVYVPMRRDLRSLGRQFGVDRWTAWGGYALAVVGVASVSALAGSLPSNGFVTLGLWALYFPGWFGLVYAASNHGRYRRMCRASTPETGAVAPGDDLVAVSGEARAIEEPATTPLLGDAALCYRWNVEYHRTWPDTGWYVAGLGQGGVPFLVDDGSGPVCVDPADAQLRLVATRSRQVDDDESPPSDAVQFLEEEVGFDPTDTTHRYREYRLEPGETAYVVGAPRAPGSDGLRGGDANASAVLGGGETVLVGQGSVESVRERLGRTLRVAWVGGAGGVALGYAGMVVAAGVLGV